MSEKNGTPAVKPGAGNGTPAVKPTVEELRAEIKQTRAELGETVQALAARADVKARAMEQVEQTKQRVRVAAAAAGERVLSPLRGGGVAVGRQVRAVAGQAADKVPMDGVAGRVRTGQVPVALLFAGVLAVVGVVLVVRGRRR